MSETPCLMCTAPVADGAALCNRCSWRLAGDLDEIGRRWEDLDHAASGWARPGGDIVGGRSSGVGDRIPTGALDVIDTIQGILSTWLRLFVEEAAGHGAVVEVPTRHADATGAPSGHRWTPEFAQAVCVALSGSYAWVRHQSFVPDFAREVRYCVDMIRAVVEPPERIPAAIRELTPEQLAAAWLSVPMATLAARHVLGDHRAPGLATVKAWAGQTGRPPRLTVQEGKVQVAAVLELAAQRRPRKASAA